MLLQITGGRSLTVSGIWHAERSTGLSSEESLITFIENKWFKFQETSKPLADKEKLILFILLMLRAYSEDSAIHIRANNDVYNEKLKQITGELGDFLYSNKIIRNNNYKEELERKDTRIPAINHYFRHTDKIAKKTDGFFVASGSKYYLKLYDNDPNSMVGKLESLFSKVFESSLSYDLKQQIIKKAVETAYVQSIDIFDQSKHIFAKTEYDDLIEQAIGRAMRKA